MTRSERTGQRHSALTPEQQALLGGPMVTLTRPGSQLNIPDPHAGHIRTLLDAAEDALVDALHVLTLFEQVLAPEWGVVEETQAEADEVRYKKLAARLVGELGMDIVHCRYAVDAMLDRERWALGLKAKRLPWRLELIHGRSFVLSLNRVRCLLEALAQEPGVPTDTMRELILTLPRPMDPETRVLPEWSAPAFTVAFGRLVRNLGLRNLRFHDLRHDTASTLTMAGVQQRTVMALLGHRDPRMTLRYQHLSPEHLRDAVRALDKRQTATTVEAVGQA